MANTAHLFSLRNATDTFIIALSDDLSVYGFIGIDINEWKRIGVVELSPLKLRKYAFEPDDVIDSVSQYGHYTVPPQVVRAIRERSSN